MDYDKLMDFNEFISRDAMEAFKALWKLDKK